MAESLKIEDKELEQFRKSQRRKDIIKNITIVFLLILLALTFFSRTIMNYTLPQVATHVVAQGEVSPRIRGQGTAEVDDPYNVMMAQSRQIKRVAVRVDQKVKRGDVLYYLEDNESEDLRTARQELASLQSDYTKKLFDGSLSDVISRAAVMVTAAIGDATTPMYSGGGGGSSSDDKPKKDDDEDWWRFAHRAARYASRNKPSKSATRSPRR